jgi:hypothetical protein
VSGHAGAAHCLYGHEDISQGSERPLRSRRSFAFRFPLVCQCSGCCWSVARHGNLQADRGVAVSHCQWTGRGIGRAYCLMICNSCMSSLCVQRRSTRVSCQAAPQLGDSGGASDARWQRHWQHYWQRRLQMQWPGAAMCALNGRPALALPVAPRHADVTVARVGTVPHCLSRRIRTYWCITAAQPPATFTFETRRALSSPRLQVGSVHPRLPARPRA